MTVEEFISFARDYTIVPVSKIFLSDTLTPVSAYLRIRSGRTNSYLFESIEGGEQLARYSFIGCDPVLKVSCKGRETTIVTNGVSKTQNENYFTVLKSILANYRQPQMNNLPRFTSGLVGYIGYDMIRHIEDIPESGRDPVGIEDAMMALFSSLIVFDHLRHQLYIIINILIDKTIDTKLQFRQAQDRMRDLEEQIFQSTAPHSDFQADVKNMAPETPKPRFLSNVEKAKKFIVGRCFSGGPVPTIFDNL
jgi:anthranilate synthase component 1